MTTWANTLERFSSVIRTGVNFAPGEIICPFYEEARGIEVYRNNYRGNLHDTLASAYPVIRQLVGDAFFRLLAKRYIEQIPSRSGNLHHYGSRMARFLEHFENARHLAYLPDMARLEWAYHRAYFADDVPAFDLARLACISPESYAELRWRLHPACELLASAFPIAAIWQAHQVGASTNFNIDVNRGGENLLVYRNGLSLEIARIAPDAYHWLAQLQRGVAMGTATDATLAEFPDFDLATTLHHWLAQGVLADFDVTPEAQSGRNNDEYFA